MLLGSGSVHALFFDRPIIALSPLTEKTPATPSLIASWFRMVRINVMQNPLKSFWITMTNRPADETTQNLGSFPQNVDRLRYERTTGTERATASLCRPRLT